MPFGTSGRAIPESPQYKSCHLDAGEVFLVRRLNVQRDIRLTEHYRFRYYRIVYPYTCICSRQTGMTSFNYALRYVPQGMSKHRFLEISKSPGTTSMKNGLQILKYLNFRMPFGTSGRASNVVHEAVNTSVVTSTQERSSLSICHNCRNTLNASFSSRSWSLDLTEMVHLSVYLPKMQHEKTNLLSSV